MDILDIFKIISAISTVVLLMIAWKKLSLTSLRVYFIVMMAFFMLPMVLPFGETRGDLWTKHLLFYSGQFTMYMYLTHLMESYQSTPSHDTPPPPQVAAAGILSLHGTQEWFDYMTDQGLEHFLTIPLLFLIITVIRIQYHYIADRALKHTLNFCMAAAGVLVMIHVGEFVIESQHWLPFMEGDPAEILEFVWYFTSLVLFWLSIHALPDQTKKIIV